MGLNSIFTNIKNNINKAESLSEKIINYDGVKYENKNQWRCKYYNISMSSAPTLATISDKTPTKTQLRSDTEKSQNWAWGDYYVGSRECWVYCTEDHNLSTYFWTDDEGRMYLNDTTSFGPSTSCRNYNVTIPFKKGWNHIQILFREGDGGDGGFLGTNLSQQSFIDEMYADRII